MRADNSRHLADAARRRSEQTMSRARQALSELQNAGQPVTMTALAARAGVSRAWLYNQAELRQQISALSSTVTQPAATAASDASLRNRLVLAHQRIRELSDDNQQLRGQIAALHGQLRAARLTSRRVAGSVRDTDSQVRQSNGQNDRR
jgi:chromosome segregation ATPase